MVKSVQYPRQAMLAGICFLFVCIIDYFTPLYTFGGIGILYIAAIWLGMRESRRIIVYTAVFATLLIILNYLYFSRIYNGQQEVIPFNRIISIIGLWIAVVVAWKSKKAEERISVQRADYVKTIEEIVYINSHKVRNHVANIVKIVELLEEDNLSDQHSLQMLAYLRRSAQELDIATREMTETISDKDYNQELLCSASVK